MPVVTGNGNSGNDRSLPEILIIDLGHGNVELVPEAILQTLDNMPFVFERVRPVDAKFESEDANGGQG